MQEKILERLLTECTNQYIDYTFTDSEDEKRADDFARETLIDAKKCEPKALQ